MAWRWSILDFLYFWVSFYLNPSLRFPAPPSLSGLIAGQLVFGAHLCSIARSLLLTKSNHFFLFLDRQFDFSLFSIKDETCNNIQPRPFICCFYVLSRCAGVFGYVSALPATSLLSPSSTLSISHDYEPWLALTDNWGSYNSLLFHSFYQLIRTGVIFWVCVRVESPPIAIRVKTVATPWITVIWGIN